MKVMRAYQRFDPSSLTPAEIAEVAEIEPQEPQTSAGLATSAGGDLAEPKTRDALPEEWTAAFAQDPTGKKGTLLPVRVAECDPKGLLPQIIYVDLLGEEEERAKELLLAGANRERAKPATPPSFPSSAPPNDPPPTFPGALSRIWTGLLGSRGADALRPGGDTH